MNQTALEFIKQHEGCRLTAYQDSAGVWTIGYGATGPDIVKGVVWTQETADARLATDISKTEFDLSGLLARRGVALSYKSTAALISFVFNLGLGTLAKSTLMRCIQQKDWPNIVQQWIRFDHAGGHDVRGLMIRRLEEAALFLQGYD